uniref:Alpha/beta-Hydrolases superfamily protein n=1 Tax=Nelumbo nucifera TaxID=4432 RepID=A0A823A3C8_NELNU|nr:TPA_asm: hypothetical protein HUJ06_018505 [Nelumbo nucifera]
MAALMCFLDKIESSPPSLQLGKSLRHRPGSKVYLIDSLHRDLMIGFGTWEFDPMDLKNPFPNNEGTVHLWMGDEDGFVPVTLQRYIAVIAGKLPWIHYHELPGSGHMIRYIDGMNDAIVKSLLLGEK